MNPHWSFGVRFLWVKVLAILFLLQPLKLKAQIEPFLFDEQLGYALEDERLRSNSVLLSSGSAVSWQDFDSVISNSIDSLRAQFNADSIHWNFIKDSIPFQVSIPNDISLLMGGDRGQLQDFLLERLINDSRVAEIAGSDTTIIDALWQRSATRYEVLQHISVIDSLDSIPVCHSLYPVASAINSINDTLSCDGLYPVKLIFNRYGFERDSVNTDITSLMKITGASGWQKWFAIEDEEITVMLQHPYFAFDHMLFLRMQDDGAKNYWLGEMHSFIPSHNLGDLYSKYSEKEGAERFEIK